MTDIISTVAAIRAELPMGFGGLRVSLDGIEMAAKHYYMPGESLSALRGHLERVVRRAVGECAPDAAGGFRERINAIMQRISS